MSEEELNRWREKIRNQWRIAEECGQPPSEAEKTRDMVLIEMKANCSNLDRCLAVAKYAADWVETQNPFNIDAAVYLCGLEGISPPPALAVQVAAVAKARFLGKTRAGTADQITKANARGYAMLLMAKLCAAGASVETAASKVARHLAELKGPTFKASSLEKYFAKQPKGLQHHLREIFEAEPEHLAEWRATLETLPDASPELKGERR